MADDTAPLTPFQRALVSGSAVGATAKKLAAEDEARFQSWYADTAHRLKINPNPDDPNHFYDYRGFYKDMEQGKAQAPDEEGDHFTSQYKLPGHPRTYLGDGTGRIFDTRSAQYLDGSQVPDEQLTASELSADMPGFDPLRAQAFQNALLARGRR